MDCVTCVKIGKKYSSTYVNNLYNAVRKYTDNDFICFTEDPSGIDPNVIVYHMQPLVEDPSKWRDPKRARIGIQSWWPAWNKLELFGREELDKYDKKIFFDLDLVIQSDITSILDFETNFGIIHCRWKSSDWVKIHHTNKKPAFALNSSCMVWRDIKFIYEQYIPNWKKYVRMYKGIDPYINQNHFSDLEFLPDVFYSYREGSNPEHFWDGDETPYLKYMPEYSICLFHQEPEIHELNHDHILYKTWNDTL